MAYETETTLPQARIDEAAGTVTLPLHRGSMRDGRTAWYVVTDASDRRVAKRFGANWSPKLANAPDAATRSATLSGRGELAFDRGAVDFAPVRQVVPGPAPAFFPPTVAQPGSIGDAQYSPLVRITNRRGVVLNATVVAFDVGASQIEFPGGGVDHSKVIDRAVAISPRAGTITMLLSTGTASDRPVLFISLDSNSPVVSALESSTFAPALANLPVGRNDAPDSAVAVNFIIANGATGADNPQRQGLNSALSDPRGQVLDVFDGAPDILQDAAYSPGGPVGASGLISNCPIVGHL